MKDRSMWWRDRKERLMALCTDLSPLIVYDEETLNDLFFDLLSIDSIDRHLYAVGTNPHPGILNKAFEMGLDFLIRIPEEEELVRTSCPGITPDRFFFNPKTLSFPKISIRNHPGAAREGPERDRDVQDYLKDIEKIKEEYPDSEIWFTCGPRELSPAGVLIMRVTGQMKNRNGFLVRLGEKFSERISLHKDIISMEIFNLSRLDRNPMPLPYTLEPDRGKVKVTCRTGASRRFKEGDILLIPGMGASMTMYKGGKPLSERDQRREVILRARKMCPVKI